MISFYACVGNKKKGKRREKKPLHLNATKTLHPSEFKEVVLKRLKVTSVLLNFLSRVTFKVFIYREPLSTE